MAHEGLKQTAERIIAELKGKDSEGANAVLRKARRWGVGVDDLLKDKVEVPGHVFDEQRGIFVSIEPNRKFNNSGTSTLSEYAQYLANRTKNGKPVSRQEDSRLAELTWASAVSLKTEPDDKLTEDVSNEAAPSERAKIARRSLTVGELVLDRHNLKGSWDDYMRKLPKEAKPVEVLREPVWAKSKFSEATGDQLPPVSWSTRKEDHWQVINRREVLFGVTEAGIPVDKGNEPAGMVGRRLSIVRNTLHVSVPDLLEVSDAHEPPQDEFTPVSPEHAEMMELFLHDYAETGGVREDVVPAISSLALSSEIKFRQTSST